jgi:hypothetical protein
MGDSKDRRDLQALQGEPCTKKSFTFAVIADILNSLFSADLFAVSLKDVGSGHHEPQCVDTSSHAASFQRDHEEKDPTLKRPLNLLLLLQMLRVMECMKI